MAGSNLNQSSILLESGTNELEIVEFIINGNSFGINVAKVQNINPYSKITPIPNSHSSIKGLIKPRDEVMTVIDLPKHLNMENNSLETDNMFIITNFNKTMTAFLVHSIVGIQKFSWTDVEKPDPTYGGYDSIATGIVKSKDRLIIILDFEKILFDIAPATGISLEGLDKKFLKERSKKHVLIAEDSEFLSKLLLDALTIAGYTDVTSTIDGQQAWHELLDLKDQCRDGNIFDKIACVITDLEMPQMDGHHLLKKIKEDEVLKALPVIIFSSLINKEMKLKGSSLGADAQISKPEINELIGLVDQLTLVHVAAKSS